MKRVISSVRKLPWELLWNLTLRELRGKYRRSFLGWSWSLLNPLASVLIYGFIFGVVFGAVPPVGDPSGITSYAVFLLVGLIPWAAFNLIASQGMNALISNGGLVKKVSFPRVILVYSQSLFASVQFAIEMSVLLVVVTVLGSPAWRLVPVTLGLMVLLVAFATGIGLVLAVVSVYFRDLPYLWTIVIQTYFFLTPVVYQLENVEGQLPTVFYEIVRLNPMAIFVKDFRHMFYDGSLPPLGDVAVVGLAAFVSMIVGYLVFVRLNRRVAEEL